MSLRETIARIHRQALDGQVRTLLLVLAASLILCGVTLIARSLRPR